MTLLPYTQTGSIILRKGGIFLGMTMAILTGCSKSAIKPKPPAPVFSVAITYSKGQNTTNFSGLTTFLIHFSNRNLFVLQSNATTDTSQESILNHPAFNFAIYAQLAPGVFDFAAPGPSANEGEFSTGSSAVVYTFQPDPYKPAGVGGNLTITKYESAVVSGSLYAIGMNSNLDTSDKIQVNGDFSNIPVVER